MFLEVVKLPSLSAEEKMCIDLYGMESCYPCKIFTQKELKRVDFDPITVFYGGNGSGKTTLLNIIADKLQLQRKKLRTDNVIFDRYVDECVIKCSKTTYQIGKLIASDDVFAHITKILENNLEISRRREAEKKLFEYARHTPVKLKSIADYDELKTFVQATKSTQRSFVRDRAGEIEKEFSNGETAIMYFDNEIQDNGLYLLDEPENSLSPKFQLQLAKIISDSVRYFGCQFVISTHSPFFLSLEKAKIYNLDVIPASVDTWHSLENMQIYYKLFSLHKDLFEAATEED